MDLLDIFYIVFVFEDLRVYLFFQAGAQQDQGFG